MLICQNDIAKIWSCGMSVDLDYRKEEAIDILKNLSENDDKIVSRDAGMLLFVKTNMESKA